MSRVVLGIYMVEDQGEDDSELGGGAMPGSFCSFYVAGPFDEIPRVTFHEVTHLTLNSSNRFKHFDQNRIFTEGATELISRLAFPYSPNDWEKRTYKVAYPGYTLLVTLAGGETLIPDAFSDPDLYATLSTLPDFNGLALCPHPLRQRLEALLQALDIPHDQQRDSLIDLEEIYCINYGDSATNSFPDYELDQGYRIHLLKAWGDSQGISLAQLAAIAAPTSHLQTEWEDYSESVEKYPWFTKF